MQPPTIEKQIRDGQLRYKPKPNAQPPEKKPAKTTDQRLANSFSKVGQRKGQANQQTRRQAAQEEKAKVLAKIKDTPEVDSPDEDV